MLKKPDILALKKAGFTLTDMHYHSKASDTFTKIPDILKRASQLGINVAITDHNVIHGNREAYNNRHKVNIIPGIEISCIEGHHILVYFTTYELLDQFYNKHMKGRVSKKPHTLTNIATHELLDWCEDFDCLTSAAHPFSVGQLNMGRNIDRGFVKKNAIDRINAIEAICGATGNTASLKALRLIHKTGKPFTGGSDGHALNVLGSVVVATRSHTTKGILQEIRERRNLVIGQRVPWYAAIPSYLGIGLNHLPTLPSILRFKYNNLYKRNFRYYEEQLKKRLP